MKVLVLFVSLSDTINFKQHFFNTWIYAGLRIIHTNEIMYCCLLYTVMQTLTLALVATRVTEPVNVTVIQS